MSSGNRNRAGPVESPPEPSTDRPRHSRYVVHFDLANVALANVVVVLVIRAFSFFDVIRNVILLLVLAILLAAAIDPLVVRLRRGGLRRVTSVLGIYVVLASLTAGFVVIAANTVSQQVALLIKDLPTLTSRLSSLPASLPAGLIRRLVL